MNERLTLELEAKALGQESIERLTVAMERLANASDGVGRRGTAGLGNGLAGVGDAAEAAHKKVQTFVGAIPGMGVAAERFINLIPGLGAVITQAFPLLGLVAFTEGIGRLGPMVTELAGKFDPLTMAQNRATEAAKEYNAEITRISEKLDKFRHQGFDSAFGKSAGAALQLGELQGKRLQAIQNVKSAEGDLAKAQADLAPQYDFLTGERTNAEGSREFRRAKTEVDTATKALTAFQQKLNEIDADMGKLSVDSAQAQSELTKSALQKVEETSKAIRAFVLSGQMSAYGVTAFDKIRSETAEFTRSHGSNDDIKSAERLKIAAEINRQSSEQRGFAVFKGVNENSQILKGGEEYGRDMLAGLDRNAKAVLDRLKEWNTQLKQSDEANILGIRGGAEHASRMVSLSARPGGEVAALQASLTLRQQAVEKELAIKEAHSNLYNMDAERFRLNNEMQDSQYKFEEGIQELRNKNLASWRDSVVRGFDELIAGRGGNILKSFAVGFERQIIGNLATEIYPQIQKAMQGTHMASGGFMGRLLSGTPFGPDPLKGATDQNTAATIANTQALLGIGGGVSGAAVGAIGAIGQGGLFSGPDPNNPGIFHYSGLDADGLPVRSSTMGGIAAGFPGMGKFTSGFAKYGGASLAIGGGALAAIHGFSRGGASGAFEGTAGIAAAAGAVLPLISKSLAFAGPLGMIAGMGLGLLGSLFGHSKQDREKEISEAINKSVYHAPQAINATMDGSGNYVDFDSRGNLRRSTLSGMPQTRNPYTRWQDGQPYEAPGSETSPYTVVNNYHINAVDAPSFQDFARRNSTAIADAVADHLGTTEGRLSGAVRYAASA